MDGMHFFHSGDAESQEELSAGPVLRTALVVTVVGAALTLFVLFGMHVTGYPLLDVVGGPVFVRPW